MLALQILGVFSLLSILAVGGGAAVLPEMKSLTVGASPWITADQFGQIYSLGQLAPGPNMLMVSVIGYHVCGFAGALAALVGFFVPSGVITFYAGKLWDRFADNPWRASLARGLGPVTVGLILAGAISIERTVMAGEGVLPYVIAAAVVLILLRVKINPVFLILAGGVVTWLAKMAP
ncbi:MAG TPA: chromate transporter [Candidatus Binatia bacterium]|nr:chromate transporter [Candidatus Binatia bacterium]